MLRRFPVEQRHESFVIRKALRNLSVLSAAVGSQLPGVTYFLNWAPPLFTPTVLLTSGVGLATFIKVFFINPQSDGAEKSGYRAVVAAVIIASLYGILFNEFTVRSPHRTDAAEKTYQIGFGTQEFSLTDAAKAVQVQYGLKTSEELMLAFGGYEPGAIKLIWHEWSILAAGAILIALFVPCYLLWTYGLAVLARGLSTRMQTSAQSNLTKRCSCQEKPETRGLGAIL
jgi:hypothetical protein